jgi:ubiquinone/menaquinone biosynthesis C-methylase UbiE
MLRHLILMVNLITMGVYENKIFPIINDYITKAFDHFRQVLLSHASGKVLEVGMGSGMTFGFYPDVVSKVDGIDPNLGMLKRLDSNIDPRITIHKARAEDLAFEDNTFDTVVCFLVLCSVSDVKKSLFEIKRVLKNDGKLLFFEHVAPITGSFHASLFKALNPIWKIPTCGCNLTRDTMSLMQECGFDVTLSAFDKRPSRIIPFIRGQAVISL